MTKTMNILDEIVLHKQREVAERKQQRPLSQLEDSPYFKREPYSLRHFLVRADKTGIIAEFKRKSPSRGVINGSASVAQVVAGYTAAGASAISVLSDHTFFGGSTEDVMMARLATNCPILRKDFVIDEYQVVEAKSMGADVILLIAAILTPAQATQLAQVAHGLGMEVLLEVHNEEELQLHQHIGADVIGVNNRNLKTFEVDVATSLRLAQLIPQEIIKVSESGLSEPETVVQLRSAGYRGFLMGENFMKHAHPEQAARVFMDALRKLSKK